MIAHSFPTLKNIEKRFMELLRNLREKIETLEKEKASLLTEIESLKQKGKAKARELENEVTMLKKEVKALETLLNVKEKPRNKEIQKWGFLLKQGVLCAREVNARSCWDA